MGERFAFCKSVSVIWVRPGPENECIEGVFGMHVEIAEVGRALSICSKCGISPEDGQAGGEQQLKHTGRPVKISGSGWHEDSFHFSNVLQDSA